MTLASIFYGSFPIITKFLLNLGIEPLSLIVSSAIFIMIFGISYLLINLSKVKEISRKNWFKILLITFLATSIGNILIFIGQSLTTATNLSFLIKLTGLTVLPFAYFMLGEKLKRKDFIAFMIVISGVFLLTTNGTLITPNLGDILIIILAIIIGFTNSLAKQIMKDVSPNVISSLRILIGNLLLIGFIVPLGYASFTPLFIQPFWILIGAIFGTSSIFLLYKGIELAGASKATIFFLLSAIFTAVFAFIFLGEVLSYIQWIGAACILGGAYLLARK
ncbi:MAG: DMT family transporter [Candidatus Aenigmarchaeota archaeon]|nr:DMT family transporter [Candidatus Aenigmarchaeota archaeon]